MKGSEWGTSGDESGTRGNQGETKVKDVMTEWMRSITIKDEELGYTRKRKKCEGRKSG